MIEVSKGVAKATYPIDKLAAIAVQLAGGGYTVAQTAKAMEIQSELQAGKTVRSEEHTSELQSH